LGKKLGDVTVAPLTRRDGFDLFREKSVDCVDFC
jgi:hypothetical protein